MERAIWYFRWMMVWVCIRLMFWAMPESGFKRDVACLLGEYARTHRPSAITTRLARKGNHE